MRYALAIPPGVVSDDTEMAKGGRWSDADKVRFVRLAAQLIGGHERIFRTDIEGICRGAFTWYDNAGSLNIALGTHTHAYVWKGGLLTDITPTLAMPPIILGGLLTPNPLTTVNADATVTVAHPDHGLVDGETVIISGATAVGGITPNGTFVVDVADADSYTFEFTSPASSGASGGGTAVRIAPQRAFAAGQVNGTGGRGWGTGAYGVGEYGQPSDTEYFPRTWAFGQLGESLVASPRGGAIYLWSNDVADNLEPILNAPRTVSHMFTTPERIIMAVGANKEDGTGFDPRCVRHCDPRLAMPNSDEPGFEVWRSDSNTLARQKLLEGAGRLVAGRNAGFGSFLWTDNELWDVRYVGSLAEVFSYTKLGEDCGLVGPNAAAIRNQRAYWWTLDFQFMTCALGGEPAAIDCPHRDELQQNLAPVQRDKIFASSISGHDEVWFFYPDNRDGLENSRAIFLSTKEGWWSKAQMARTAFIDAGPALYPLGADTDGQVFWHERGDSADGSAISWLLASAPQFIDSGERLVYVRKFYPDFKGQLGAITLYIITREEAQDDPVRHGPFVITPTTKEVDLDIQARLVSFELSGSSVPAAFRLGSIIFEGRSAGKR